jgi:hypothetical protein
MTRQFASSRTKIALIETDWDGHHRFFCNSFARILLELGHSVIVFSPEPADVSAWLEKNLVKTDRLQVLELQPPQASSLPFSRISEPLTTIARWKSAANAIEQIAPNPPHLTFFPSLDHYLVSGVTHHLVDWIFPHPWAGLYLHPSYLRRPSRYISERMFAPSSVLKSERCRVVAVLDEGVAEKLEEEIQKRVVIFPDVADAACPDTAFALLSEIRERARGRKIIGLLGSLELRKGFWNLLEAARMTTGEPWFYLFAGRLSDEHMLQEHWARLQRLASMQPENCFFHFQHIPSEEQFNALVEMCDIVFAAYLKFTSSSNLLGKAALHRKLLIVSDGYCMGERVERFRLGLTIPEGNVGRCVDALHQLLDEHGAEQLHPDFEGYCNIHSSAQLAKGLEAIVEAGIVTD